MTTFIIIYVVNYLVQIVEGIGIAVLTTKLDVDWYEVYARVGEHAPFGTYRLTQWYFLILDLLIASPLLGHFMAAFMVVESFQLYNEKKAAE